MKCDREIKREVYNEVFSKDVNIDRTIGQKIGHNLLACTEIDVMKYNKYKIFSDWILLQIFFKVKAFSVVLEMLVILVYAIKIQFSTGMS